LFPDDAPVRLVTTNFDTHLSTTLKQQFGSAFETFHAPALPLGDDFTGLVYLHGAAAKNAEQCVLTDEDFWASLPDTRLGNQIPGSDVSALCRTFRRL
jgi:hypothetical protein